MHAGSPPLPPPRRPRRWLWWAPCPRSGESVWPLRRWRDACPADAACTATVTLLAPDSDAKDRVGDTEAADGAAAEHTREWYVGVYRDGQRRLLRAALEEVASLSDDAAGMQGEEEEEGEEEREE